eukprot:4909368-Amphidinium_carterae.1
MEKERAQLVSDLSSQQRETHAEILRQLQGLRTTKAQMHVHKLDSQYDIGVWCTTQDSGDPVCSS